MQKHTKNLQLLCRYQYADPWKIAALTFMQKHTKNLQLLCRYQYADPWKIAALVNGQWLVPNIESIAGSQTQYI